MRRSIRSDCSRTSPAIRETTRPGAQSVREGGTPETERAVLASVLLPDARVDLSNPLGELAALAASAGTEVVDSLTQKRMRLSSVSAFGKGKLAELAERTESANADVVIFDNDLSPRQIRNIEKAVARKVIDRSELILDIFASRAKTHEAQIQVELAQLQYAAPRLRGMWTHLERIAGAGGATAAGSVGGVGTRGPGERQIEVDRRIVRDRITYLSKAIAEIDRRKQREVESRKDWFTVSLVGYTNSGKSTLMNRLTSAQRFVADQLFATLDTKTLTWDLGDRCSVLLSDTVGFVRDIPHHLVASFRATLEEAIHADLLLHIVDVSSPTAWQQLDVVDEVLSELNCGEVPQIVLLNKVDVANDMSIAEMLECHRPGSLCISAKTGEGIDALMDRVKQRVQVESAQVTIFARHSEGKLLSEIDRIAEVTDRRYTQEGVEMDIRMNRAQLAQLLGRYDTLSVIKGDGGVWDESSDDALA